MKMKMCWGLWNLLIVGLKLEVVRGGLGVSGEKGKLTIYNGDGVGRGEKF
jgi:hypothetical protein